MTPRAYKPDPNRMVIFGQWPYDGDEGAISELEFLPNPPVPEEGATLLERGRATSTSKEPVWHYKKLRKSDQLTQMQAAAFLRVSRMQINRWVNSGELRARTVLGVSRITVRDAIAFGHKRALLPRRHVSK